jgi:hypothetical protein
MHNSRQIWFACAFAVAACCAAADDSALPLVQQQGAVSYVAGGVGQDESDAIKAAMPHYALNLTFAVHRGAKDEYGADAQVEIHNAAGTTVLSTPVAGPYLLVNLPAGRYSVQATASGHAQSKSVDIVAGQSRKAIFVWPSEQVDAPGSGS